MFDKLKIYKWFRSVMLNFSMKLTATFWNQQAWARLDHPIICVSTTTWTFIDPHSPAIPPSMSLLHHLPEPLPSFTTGIHHSHHHCCHLRRHLNIAARINSNSRAVIPLIELTIIFCRCEYKLLYGHWIVIITQTKSYSKHSKEINCI